MDHKEQHHEHHQMERQEHKHKRHARHPDGNASSWPVHPLWLLIAGVLGTLLAVLVWTLAV